MPKYTYTLLNTIFFLPIILFLLLKYGKIIKKNWRFISRAGLIGSGYFFVVDIFATSFRAWEYDYTKVLGIRFHFAVLEELVWMILVFLIVAVVIEIYFFRIKNKQKITLIIGLPGSGKSTYIENNRDEFGDAIICDDYHKSTDMPSRNFNHSGYYEELKTGLLAGKNAVITDIAYCKKDRLEQVTKDIQEMLTDLQSEAVVEYRYFENNPSASIKNILRRNRDGRVEREIDFINKTSLEYKIPEGIKTIPVFRK